VAVDRLDPILADYIAQAQAIVAETVPGAALVVISAYRSPQSQAALRRRFHVGDRSGLASEPAAESLHTVGRAVDLQFRYAGQLVPVAETPMEYWEYVAELLEPVGVRWGGRFRSPDPNHFDL
jgi:D-alanyl-D-alanine dipeptidase